MVRTKIHQLTLASPIDRDLDASPVPINPLKMRSCTKKRQNRPKTDKKKKKKLFSGLTNTKKSPSCQIVTSSHVTSPNAHKSRKKSKSTQYKSKMPALNPEKKSKSNCSKSNLPKIHKKVLSPTERSQPQISIKSTRNKSKMPAKKSKSIYPQPICLQIQQKRLSPHEKSLRDKSKRSALNPEKRLSPQPIWLKSCKKSKFTDWTDQSPYHSSQYPYSPPGRVIWVLVSPHKTSLRDKPTVLNPKKV